MPSTAGGSRSRREPSYLDEILAAHRWRRGVRPLGRLLDEARSQPPARPFSATLAAEPGVSLIAEVKRRSPSRGPLRPGLDPAMIARAYEAGGARCVSVLTDGKFFGGSPEDLRAARDAVAVPVLRKDFTVCDADVCQARLMGADAVLLIVAALSDEELARFVALARYVGIDALVEVHDEEDLSRAMDAGASLVGVNQRDLFTFEVDPDRAARLLPLVPDGVVKVAESGISGPREVVALGERGFDAVLVGEALVTAPDPGAAARSLAEAGRLPSPASASRGREPGK